MTEYVEMKVCCRLTSDLAALLVVHEDEPEEEEIWVPKSCIEDLEALDEINPECTISIAIWFLNKNDIEYSEGL